MTNQSRKPRKPRWHISQFKVPEAPGKVRFHDLFLPIALMRAIHELNYEYCSPIQGMTLPYTLAGHDCIGKAQTGTGKTAAFLITVITDLMEHRLPEQYAGEPRALILAPTRELALQIAEDAKLLTKHSRLKVAALVGGMDMDKQRKQLQESRLDILVATPGRLLDFMNRKEVFLDQVETLVIDEADRMLDMGFIPDIKSIVRNTPRNEERQTLMFSATFSYDILNLAERWTKDAVRVEVEPKVKTAEQVEQHVFLVTAEEKYNLLRHALKQPGADKVMVFANRRDIVRDLSDRLRKDGIQNQVLSGEVPQAKRVKTLDNFKEGKVPVLVATDVAGRGIHVDGVSHVVNYTLPEDPEDYVHRIGRTGRAGAKGQSISFACEDDSFQIPAIEDYIKHKIDLEQPPQDWLQDLQASDDADAAEAADKAEKMAAAAESESQPVEDDDEAASFGPGNEAESERQQGNV
ncbi:ATP-dependent RNA helicase RhlB [Saccharospirillum sp. HFRX-1]|uniref:ATP-dependent RNA helicase RhlB n=1 Tax=unclassified Saccharospirillum TaxID=2633430 RepID=UPI00371C89C3